MATHQIAQGLAGLGRNGDSVLVHMSPHEVAGLQSLAQKHGTSLTINPHTGMPEAFSLGGLFKAALPMAAGFALGPAGFGLMDSALGAGMLVGAATGLMTGSPLQGVMGGMGAYGGFNLGSTLANAGEGVAKSVEETAKNATKNLAQSGAQLSPEQLASLNPEAAANAATANAASTNQLYMPHTAEMAGQSANIANTANIAPNFNPAGGYVPGTDIGTSTFGGGNYATEANNFGMGSTAGTPAEMTKFDYAMKGIKDLPTAQGWQNYVNAGGSGMQLGMAAAGPIMGGLERSDIYGDPVTGKKKVIPTLNLGDAGYTPLNLDTNYPTSYAAGGPIAFADGGQADASPALQGAPQVPLNTNTPNNFSLFESFAPGMLQFFGGNQIAPSSYGNFSPVIASLNQRGSAQAPQMGLFASQEEIDAARAEQAAAQKQARPNNYGMPWMSGLGLGLNGLDPMGGLGGSYNPYNGLGNTNTNPLNGLNGNNPMYAMFQAAQPANKNATAIDHLNLGPSYQTGGDVSMSTANGGGMYNQYNALSTNMNTPDGTHQQNTPSEGYGIGRLDSLAASKTPFYAVGGNVGNPGFGIGALDNMAAKSEPIYARGGYLDGPGDGMSDSIPATIEGKQPARLADGEFVVPADVVSHLGNGSTKAGSQRLYGMLDKVRKARTGTTKQGKQINAAKYMPA